jgi:hypothetical protein
MLLVFLRLRRRDMESLLKLTSILSKIREENDFFASVIHGVSFWLPKARSKLDSLIKKVYLVDTRHG